MQRGLLARRWPPSLLVRFGVVTFVLLATVAVVLAGEVRDLQAQRSLQDARARAIDTAHAAVQPQLTPADLARDFVALEAATISRLERAARSAISDAGIVGITIWNPQHWIVYSDDAALIGRWVADDEDLVAALGGETSSEVTSPESERSSERGFGDLLEVYVPLRVGADGAFTTDGTGAVAGVLEVDAPYAPVEAAIAADRRALHVSIAIGFVVLHLGLLGLFGLVLGASRRVRPPAGDDRIHVSPDPMTLLPDRPPVVADVARLLVGGTARVDADALDQHRPEQPGIVAELRGALAAGQISVAYQPQLDLRTGEVHAVEALVRWHHPARGLVQPGELLPLVERTDLIGTLTWEVLGQSLARCALWRQSGIDLRVAVSLSAGAVSDPALVGQVRAALARHGVPASALELDLAARAVLGDRAGASAVLAELRTLGVRLAVDDVGTGDASIDHLGALPLDALKIDRSFVGAVTAGTSATAIVGRTLDLARHLGVEVVANGIEDAPTLEHLRRLGCDVGQGDGIARPMPAEEVGGWVTAWNAAARRVRTAPDAAAGAPTPARAR